MELQITPRERVQLALQHREADRVPTWEFFWPSFEDRWREEKRVSSDADIYQYYAIDIKWLLPDTYPRAGGETVLEKARDYEIVRDGWGIVQKRSMTAYSTPQFLDFPIKSEADLRGLEFDPPDDLRRYKEDIVRVRREKDQFAFFGRAFGPYRAHWQLRGPEQSFYDMFDRPEFVNDLVTKVTNFVIETGIAQLRLIKGLLGMFIYDDIAHNEGLLFSPKTYRELYFPHLQRMCQRFKENGARFIAYHSDGDIREAIPYLIEAGVDAIQPLEARAGMDVVELKESWGQQLAFIGNVDNTGVLPSGSKGQIKSEVLRKLAAAKGGGYIVGSSHSIGDDVPIENYEYFRELVEHHGRYPLILPEGCEEAL